MSFATARDESNTKRFSVLASGALAKRLKALGRWGKLDETQEAPLTRNFQ